LLCFLKNFGIDVRSRAPNRIQLLAERTQPSYGKRGAEIMAFVVTEPCFGCKYTDCVVVCPCDCFHEGEQMLYIDPEHCIDCEACLPECPVEAIFYEENVPAEWRDYIALNAEMAPKCPQITERKEPLAGRS
jgi:ferredoxin